MQVALPATTIDAVSLIAPGAPAEQRWRPTRELLFAERFQKNWAPPPVPHKLLARALLLGRYKLVRKHTNDELYDLALDPWETNDLLTGTVTPKSAAAYSALKAALNGLLSSQ
jgi:hypothetical protein